MFILNVICETTSFLRLLYFVKLARMLLFIVVPIGLIITIILKLYKSVISGGEDIKEILPTSLKKVLATLILFIIPSVVSFIISFTGMEFKDTYNTCLSNATLEKIDYYANVELKVSEAQELIDSIKMMPTTNNLKKAEEAVSKLYGVANGSIIEDLEYELASIRTKITMSDEEFLCKSKGGVYKDGNCEMITANGGGIRSSSGMVYYTYKTQNDYLVVNTKLSVSEYVKFVESNHICQKQESSTYWDQCLCFAEEHMHALTTGDKSKKPSQITESYYSGFVNKSDNDDKSVILKLIYSELVSNKPVILQVNGNKDGTSRHYVTVLGFKSTVTSADNLKEEDLLLLDSYDGKVKELHPYPTSRFMTTGAKCKKDYSGYQVYMLV